MSAVWGGTPEPDDEPDFHFGFTKPVAMDVMVAILDALSDAFPEASIRNASLPGVAAGLAWGVYLNRNHTEEHHG